MHNRYFAERLHINRLLLHCHTMVFTHPITHATVRVTAELSGSFAQLISQQNWLFQEA